MSWRKVSGVLCDRKLSAKVKGKMYKSVVRLTILYGMETVAVTETDGKNGSCRVENGEMGIGSDKKGQDKKRIRERDCENCNAGRQASECKATLNGHVKRRKEDYVGKRMMEMTVPGRRKRGRPRRRWMDLLREDMERVGAREGDEVDRVKWRFSLVIVLKN